ncbi:MAG TPA: ABC transporter substrate-binding protein [candidate division Zixibacteria bacterium]|nr:ABC transporter substrate-binding protein [candidate division Zixibacteria bacterium]
MISRRAISVCALLLAAAPASAQVRALKEIKVAYPIGGSTSYFWVAYRSGSFEKHGLRVQPVYIRGGRAAVQALLGRDVPIELQGGSTSVTAWAQGARELRFIGATGNRLDYVLVASQGIKTPADLKGKKIGVSQIGASSDFIARYALRRLGMNPDRDATIVGVGGAGERWAALNGGHVDASVFQPPFTLLARKTGLPVLIDLSKTEFEYIIAGVLTTTSYIHSDRETVMSFMRGLADGMDFYRDERNRDAVIRFLGDYYKSRAVDELEETRKAYTQLTPGLPWVTAKAIENVIANERSLAGMSLRPAEMLDLSFLEKLQEERRGRSKY